MTNQTNKVSDNTKTITASKPVKTKKKTNSDTVTTTTTNTTVDEVPVLPTEDSVGEGEDDGRKKRSAPTKESVINYFNELIKSIENEVESLRESDNKKKGVKFLRTLNKKLKILKNQSSRIIKQKRTSTRTNTNNNSGFLKPVKISKEMAKFTGWDSELPRSRVDVTKFLCNYIKENELQNPTDRRQILADQKLAKLLKYDAKKEGEPLTYFRVQTCLKNHFIKSDDATAVSA